MHALRSLLAVALLLAIPLVAVAGKDHGHSKEKSKDSKEPGEVTETFLTAITDEPSVQPGKRLQLELKTGATVRIRGWKKSSVEVMGGHHEGDCVDAKVETKGNDDGVRVVSWYDKSSNVHYCSMVIEIQVPEKYDVEIRSSGGGVEIQNLRGTIEGHTGGGDIRLDHVQGTVDLHTGGGDLYVADSELDGDLHSGGGDVKSLRVSGDVQLSAGGKRYR
jgi:DUF4097 and DUF4098 domain-containing protein YvlB